MPLIVEDGTGVTNANSYVTVAEADAYFADRNIVDWAGAGATSAKKEGLLIQAADYLNMFFLMRGEPLDVAQAMGLPTTEYDWIPTAVKHAQLLLAREANTAPLFKPLGERLVSSERKQLQGVGEKEVHYERSNVDPYGMVGSAVASMLRPYALEGVSIQQARVDYGT